LILLKHYGTKNITFSNGNPDMVKRVKKAIFPVAGLGTRFLPATKALSKEMFPVVDKPLIQYALEEAREAGIEEYIFVTGRSKSTIQDHFGRSYELEKILIDNNKSELVEEIKSWVPDPSQISYVRQQKALGLGHAVWCARNNIGDEPFAVLLADDLVLSNPGCLAQMMEVYAEVKGNVVAIEEVPIEKVNRYGVLDIESEDGVIVKAKGLVEKPSPKVAPSNLSIIGRYILQPDVFRKLDNQEKGAGNEVQLTDAIAETLNDIPFHGFKFAGKRFDCGSRLGYLEANLAYALERPSMKDDILSIINKYC
tara:strand:+ start:655 stop:1584 length:930 start_codon:yes stop_codon:yes gene_type:complete